MGIVMIYGLFTHDSALLELNRIFIILLLLWMAWPELEKLPRWLLILIPICAIACAWRPQYLLIVIPLTILYLFLRKPSSSTRKR